MKTWILSISFLIFGSHTLHAETVIQKVDRSAHEAVEEVKSASKTIIRKLKKNTNSEKDPEPANKKSSKGVIMSDPKNLSVATLAGGCFWGVEEILRKINGVVSTEVGYTGGIGIAPTYEQVKTGTTGHAEAVQIKFDPSKISYEELLGYFFRLHDPTQLNRQENDIGTQYRSAIFYHDEKQKEIAQKVRDQVEASGKWKKKVVTEITPFKTWYPAESYHQDYLQKNPEGYNCHFLRD